MRIWIIIGLLYIVLAAEIFRHAEIRDHADTNDYYEVASLPLSDFSFWVGERPFGLPLLFKLANNRPEKIVLIQFCLWIWANLIFSLTIYTVLEKPWLKLAGFSLMLAYSLNPDVFLWNKLLHTESLSGSLLLLFLAASFWGVRYLIRHPEPKNQLLVSAGLVFLMASLVFTRDTNGYLLLFLGGVLLAGFMLAWRWARRWWRVVAIIFISSILLWWIQDHSNTVGSRWEFPVADAFSKRILIDPDKTRFFEERGLVVTDEVLAITEQKPVVDWTPMQPWFREKAKRAYILFLFLHPIDHLPLPIQNWGEIFNTHLYYWSGRGIPPLGQQALDFAMYPRGFWFLGLWLVNLVMGAWLLWKRRHSELVIVPALMIAVIYPQMFVIWHGSAEEIPRHGYGLLVQTHLAIWVLLCMNLDRLRAEDWQQSRRFLGTMLAIGLLGLGAEASLREDRIAENITGPLILNVFGDYNLLRNWGMNEIEHRIYHEVGTDNNMIEARLLNPSNTSRQKRLLWINGLFDELDENDFDWDRRTAAHIWHRTALPGYLYGADYLFFDLRWWGELLPYQQETIQNPEYYEFIREWELERGAVYRLYRIVGDQLSWENQSLPATQQLGLTDPDFAYYQDQKASFDLIPQEGIIFSPETQLKDPLTIQVEIARYIADLDDTEARQDLVDFMIVLERIQYQYQLNLSAEESQALAQWRARKDADDLAASGVDYLYFSQVWWAFLTQEEQLAILNGDYDLIQEWYLPLTNQVYWLYRVN